MRVGFFSFEPQDLDNPFFQVSETFTSSTLYMEDDTFSITVIIGTRISEIKKSKKKTCHARKIVRHGIHTEHGRRSFYGREEGELSRGQATLPQRVFACTL